MSDVKHIDIAEFQQLGFLQEANRLFFHPHGLALELTCVREEEDALAGEKSFSTISAKESDVAILHRLVTEAQARGEDVGELPKALDGATVYRPGDCWLSGVWDYRDDPEGIAFGSGDYGDSQERADTVAAERAKHVEHRKAWFGTDSDIEALDWHYHDVEDGGQQ